MFKPSVLVVALLLSSTALWSAFVTGSLSVTAALVRFLIAVPVAAVMVCGFKAVVAGYANRQDPSAPPAPAAGDESGSAAGLEASQRVR